MKTVHEVDMAAILHVLIERAVRLGDLDLVPADLGNLQPLPLRKTHHTALEESEAGRATVELLAALEHGLIADADAEERFARRGKIPGSRKQLLPLHGIDAVVERAHAGQHHSGSLTYPVGRLHQFHLGTDEPQRLFHAAQVPGAVVQQGNHLIRLSQPLG